MQLRIDISSDIVALERDWLDFQRRAAGTFYQTYQWCSAWQEKVGVHQGVEPRIVSARDERGAIRFLLPLALARRAGGLTLEWMAMAQSSYGYGLYDRDFLPEAGTWFAHDGWQIMRAMPGVDAIDLRHLPAELNGFPHPLTSWFTMRGPNQFYVMALDGDYEALYARKRSADTRRGNRKRDAKLEVAGPLEFGLPAGPVETRVLLDTMFSQQRDRLAESGIHGVFGRREREFIHRLAELPERMQPVLLPYHLTSAGSVEAVMLGGVFDGAYWALISSLGSGEARKHSPGDAALRRTIEACCKAGLTRFDFSSGDTAYKSQWADQVTPLHDIIRGVTLRGSAWAATAIAANAAKRAVKRSPWLWRFATAIRRTRART